MRLASRAFAAVKWTTLSSTVGVGSDLVRTVVLARFLVAEDYGLMAMVAIVIGLAQIYIDFGISAAIIHRQDATRDELSSLYWLNALVGGTVFVAVWLLSPLIPEFFHEPRLLPLLRAGALVFLIVPLGSQFEILLQRTCCSTCWRKSR
jgi:O-antigen/teichoic acid export membrane protein